MQLNDVEVSLQGVPIGRRNEDLGNEYYKKITNSRRRTKIQDETAPKVPRDLLDDKLFYEGKETVYHFDATKEQRKPREQSKPNPFKLPSIPQKHQLVVDVKKAREENKGNLVHGKTLYKQHLDPSRTLSHQKIETDLQMPKLNFSPPQVDQTDAEKLDQVAQANQPSETYRDIQSEYDLKERNYSEEAIKLRYIASQNITSEESAIYKHINSRIPTAKLVRNPTTLPKLDANGFVSTTSLVAARSQPNSVREDVYIPETSLAESHNEGTKRRAKIKANTNAEGMYLISSQIYPQKNLSPETIPSATKKWCHKTGGL